jgi:hypothetical protein
MLGRSIRPGATRHGQRVDNPPLENSDTARLRVLLQDETQDDWHAQRQFNIEVEKRLATSHEWRVNLHERGGAADQRDIAMLWKALGVVGAILMVVLAAVLRRLL